MFGCLRVCLFVCMRVCLVVFVCLFGGLAARLFVGVCGCLAV